MGHIPGMVWSFPLALFGMGGGEEILILGAVLIFFGGERMPELAKGLGKMLREFKKATGEVEREFKRVMDETERQTVAPFKETIAPIIKTNPLAQPMTDFAAAISAAPPPPAPATAPVPPELPPAPPPAASFPTLAPADPEPEYHSDL
jgi:sec-independent protein translocase protein TatA